MKLRNNFLCRKKQKMSFDLIELSVSELLSKSKRERWSQEKEEYEFTLFLLNALTMPEALEHASHYLKWRANYLIKKYPRLKSSLPPPPSPIPLELVGADKKVMPDPKVRIQSGRVLGCTDMSLKSSTSTTTTTAISRSSASKPVLKLIPDIVPIEAPTLDEQQTRACATSATSVDFLFSSAESQAVASEPVASAVPFPSVIPTARDVYVGATYPGTHSPAITEATDSSWMLQQQQQQQQQQQMQWQQQQFEQQQKEQYAQAFAHAYAQATLGFQTGSRAPF